MSNVDTKIIPNNSQLVLNLSADITNNNAASDVDSQRRQEVPLSFSYGQFSQAKQTIVGIEPIDYFFAKEVISSLISDNKNDHKLDTLAKDNLFHLCLALSASLRDGHTCLPLILVAGKRWGQSYVAKNYKNSQPSVNNSAVAMQSLPVDTIAKSIVQGGFNFAGLDFLQVLLTNLSIQADHQQLIVLHQDQLYIRRYFIFEQNLANAIRARLEEQYHYSQEQITCCLDSLFPPSSHPNLEENEVLDIDWQKNCGS
jgi:exodeoxyribonuclease V alpha subunit